MNTESSSLTKQTSLGGASAQPPAAGEAAHTPFEHLLPLKHNAWDCHDVTRETEIRVSCGFTLSQFSGYFSEPDELAKVREVEALHAFIVRACNSHAALVAALESIAHYSRKMGCKYTEDDLLNLLHEINSQARSALAQATQS